MRLIMVAFAFLLAARPAQACIVGDLGEPPRVTILSTPGDCCYGQWAGNVTGTATNVETDSVVVVLYAQTDLYYIQPGAGEMGKTPVMCPSGSFSNMTRGGARYCAILARRSWNPPPTMSSLPPPGGDVLAIACSGDTPYGARSINFAGLPWIVRSSGGAPQGPGPNAFSDSTANVWVDAQGRLHLRITHRAGGWQCAEVFTDLFLGYGNYRFAIETTPDSLDPRVVLGCFSYSDHYDTDGDEIDVEFSRWSQPNDVNSQFVVQPYDALGHIVRFETDATRSLHEFTWAPDRVSFVSRAGGEEAPSPEIASWTYTQEIPQPDAERMRFNLWLDHGLAPFDGREVEVIVSDFHFRDVAGVGDTGEGGEIQLGAPTPNPAFDRVSFEVRLSRAAHARVMLFDAAGRIVRRLVDAELSAGAHLLARSLTDRTGRPLHAGTYYLRLESGGWSRKRSLVIVR